MIVRIATEGQYRMAVDQLPRLRELDAAVVTAAHDGDGDVFERRFADLLEFVRSGELLDDEHLGPSDAILPPPDVTLAEATGELSTENLIPS
jgi:hypothetical protein